MVTPYEKIEPDLVVKKGDYLAPDPLADDLSIVIDADFGLVVVSGCAHRGIVNHVRRAMSLTGRKEVFAVFGGTHLLRSKEDAVSKTSAELLSLSVQKLCVSHCTGFFASAQLARDFGDRFFLNNCGTVTTLP
jgi:7,8-dihydropterin-6-yl-methyl-4-(beta-D-ribofuranosyl)aminobenzene 5'-phosphate synthase